MTQPSAHRTSRAPRGLFVLVLVMLSCFQGARAPSVEPRGVLTPGREPSAALRDNVFGVVFGSPEGETTDPSEISLVFNRPMRPLELAGEETASPAAISPSVPGAWRWVGTSALVFVPERRLTRSTTYEVSVPAGTRALDGSRLAKEYELRFSTPAPAIVRSEPSEHSSHLAPSTKFVLRWNQPVSDAELGRSLKLLVGEGRDSVPFEARHPDPANGMLTEITPKAPLPKASPIEIVMSAGFRGLEGDRAAIEEQRLSYRTYGPLVVEELACDRDTPHRRCAAGSDVTLKLSNEVKLKDLEQAIVIDPPVKLRWVSPGDDETTSWLRLDGRFAPSKSFTVRLRSSLPAKGGKTLLRDEYGQALAQDWSTRVELDDLWPRADIGIQGVYLEANEKRDVPILAVNVRELQLASIALKQDDVFAFFDGGEGSMIERLARIGARPSTVKPASAKNVAAKIWVRGDDVLGSKDRRGPIAVAIGYTERPGTSEEHRVSRARVIQITDLAITAKVSREGTLVWVTRLSTGEPVAGASVEVKRAKSDGGTTSGIFHTDADGFAVIPKERFAPRPQGNDTAAVFVRLGDDWSYRRASETLATWRYGASAEMGDDDAPFGMVFSERGIYRPGDTVKVKGIVREALPRGTSTPRGKEVELAVVGPDGEALTSLKANLTSFGTFALDVVVPQAAKLGGYSLSAKVGARSGETSDIRGSFEVAEYRPAEFKVGVDPILAGGAAAPGAYVRGDKASWTLSGDFLFGAPMSKADVRYTVTRSPASFSPPNLPDGFVVGERPYTVDLPDASPRSNEVASDRAKLDDKGRLLVNAALTMAGQREPERVTCEAEVTDVSRQSIAHETSTLVHPAEFYVALKPGADFFAKPNVAIAPEVLGVDLDGKKRSNVDVHVDLVRRTFTLARQEASDGSLHSIVTTVDKIAAGCDLVTRDAPVKCALTPTTSGYYVIRASAKDKRGNKIAAASSFYVIGDGDVGWGDSDDKRVELVPDRTSYEVGKTARILVKSPFKSAEALVTVERAGIHSRRRMTLSGPTPTIEVPITDELYPNAFVSVIIVRGRSPAAKADAGDPEVGAPTFRAGYATLLVNPEGRRLAVAVKANKETYLPGEQVDVDVEVRDQKSNKARAEVTLYAVDEGVLSLVGYKTPDPIPVFSAARPLRVFTIEGRDAIASIRVSASDLTLGYGLADKGLEGGGGGETMRRDFRQSVYFNPSLVTDANGHTHATFKLPDSLTTYRIMAVAVAEDDRFGSADAPIVASRPLMARPAFPRVLRTGDAIDAGVVLTSKGLPKTKVEVEATVEGLTLASPSNKKVVDLAVNGSLEVRFGFKAEHAGRAKVVFRARGGGASDAVEVVRTVTTPLSLEAVALYGDTTSAAGEKLGDLSSMRDDVGGLDLSVSSTALVGLGGGVEQLIEYPYGCTEQLTSRLVPILPLRDLARDFHLALPPDLDKVVEKTVALILANQRSDGGFGLFADSVRSLPWVSLYAMWGLGEARRRGAHVPDGVIEQARSYVQRELTGWDRNNMSRATAAFAVDVLAENGTPEPGWMDRLFEDRKKLPLFGEALLLHAMTVGKGDPKSARELVRDIERHIRVDGPIARAVDNTGDAYAALMDSDARTTALALRALLAVDPAHPMAARVAKGLLADRKGGTWRSTQETAWALLAIDAYRRAQEKSEPAFDARAFLGNTQVLSAEFHGRSATSQTATVAASRLVSSAGSTLAFDLDGTGRLFYEARLKYAKKELPKDALDRGFYVKKTLRVVRPEELAAAASIIPKDSVSRFGGGDIVLTDLVVVTPSPRQFVVIDDPLPSGLEPIDARLSTTAASLDVDAIAEQRPPDEDQGDRIATGSEYLSSSVRRELRDDRALFFVEHLAAGMYHYRYLARATTFGTFVVPPTRAEEMYAPEVFGRSAAITVDVAGASK